MFDDGRPVPVRNGIAMSDASTTFLAGLASVHLGHAGDSPVVTVRGELDIACRDSIGEAVARAAADSTRIVVDVSGVTFLDAGGLRALLAAASESGAEVWLRGSPTPVRRIAEVAGLWEAWNATTTGTDVRIS